MRRFDLPEGVSPSNEKQGFVAPDVATPDFAREHKTVHEKHEVYERTVEEDEEGEDDDSPMSRSLHEPHGPNVMHIMIAIALLLLALGGIVVAKNRNPTPYCSTQPEWNQYNCRPG